jgi:DNA-binding LacI/PurR family transcriptional regulator
LTKKITIKDVAALAGVAKSTVSRAFASPRLVSNETYLKVMEAAKKLQYVPNPLAQALSVSSTKNITIVVPNIESITTAGIVRGCMHYLNQYGYSLLVLDSSEDYNLELDYTNLLEKKLSDGVIFCYGSAKQVMTKMKHRFPIVFVEIVPEDPEVDYIAMDFRSGIAKIFKHLLDLKHQRIAVIFGRNDDYARNRLNTILAVAPEYNLEFPKEYLHFSNWTLQDGFEAFREIMSTKVPPTALIYISDLMAFGGLKAAAELGYKVPADITIIGTDDSPTSAYTRSTCRTSFLPKVTPVQG